MRMRVRWIALAFLAQGVMGARESADARSAAGAGRENARAYPPDMPGAQTEVYKTVGGTPLRLFVFMPEGPAPTNGRPGIVFHGKADTTVPYDSIECFAAKSKRLGNRCELVGYDGQKHGFFNYRNGPTEQFLDTLRRTDEFLASLGWLKGPPNVEEFFREGQKP